MEISPPEERADVADLQVVGLGASALLDQAADLA
jgi:hypothetical protein